jgi:23S rRNA (adenine2503-C2)-methyltransferase
MNAKAEIKSLSREELAASHLRALGEPAYRADQILQWIYEKQADSFDQMSNLSAALRQRSLPASS